MLLDPADAEDLYDASDDPMVVQAAGDLRRFFARRRMPFWLTQLECIFEKTYFHWITYQAVKQLEAEGFLVEYDAALRGKRMNFFARAGTDSSLAVLGGAV